MSILQSSSVLMFASLILLAAPLNQIALSREPTCASALYLSEYTSSTSQSLNKVNYVFPASLPTWITSGDACFFINTCRTYASNTAALEMVWLGTSVRLVDHTVKPKDELHFEFNKLRPRLLKHIFGFVELKALHVLVRCGPVWLGEFLRDGACLKTTQFNTFSTAKWKPFHKT